MDGSIKKKISHLSNQYLSFKSHSYLPIRGQSEFEGFFPRCPVPQENGHNQVILYYNTATL